MSTIKPPSFEEAVKEQVSKDAMEGEYEYIMKKDVWEVVLRPKGKSIVTSKWLYKIKHGAYGRLEKYKAMFMAKCFSEKEGEYYDEFFALVAYYSTIRSIVDLAAS